MHLSDSRVLSKELGLLYALLPLTLLPVAADAAFGGENAVVAAAVVIVADASAGVATSQRYRDSSLPEDGFPRASGYRGNTKIDLLGEWYQWDAAANFMQNAGVTPARGEAAAAGADCAATCKAAVIAS